MLISDDLNYLNYTLEDPFPDRVIFTVLEWTHLLGEPFSVV